MWKSLGLLAMVGVALISVAAFAAPTHAQETTPDDVRAQFADLTQAEIEALGYVESTPCIDASELPPEVLESLGIPASSGMGIHFINGPLIDTTLDPLQPESIQLGPDGTVWNVEYITPPQEEPLELFGQLLSYVPAVDIDGLHLWVIDNPSGEFADFNPAVSCGETAEEEEVTPVETSEPEPEAISEPEGEIEQVAAPGTLPNAGSGGIADGNVDAATNWLPLSLAAIAAAVTVVAAAVLRRRVR